MRSVGQGIEPVEGATGGIGIVGMAIQQVLRPSDERLFQMLPWVANRDRPPLSATLTVTSVPDLSCMTLNHN